MQTTSLLLGVKAKIDQACKKFTWGEASRQQKISTDNWDKMSRPKVCRGLGFKNLGMMNRALLMKVDWGLISSPTNFRLKYCLLNMAWIIKICPLCCR